MGEFASKAAAGVGMGFGIAGTTLGLLNNNNCGNGLLGGLFGNNNCNQNQLSALLAENGKLKAEKYSDQSIAAVYAASRQEYKDLLEKWITPLSDEAARNRERVAVLETSVKYENEKALLREDNIRLGLKGYIDDCCCKTNGRINDLQGQVHGLSHTLNAITSTVIPRSVICPEVMPRYNSWVAPTEAALDTQPITGSVSVSRAK